MVSASRVVVNGRAEDSDGKTARSRRLLALDPVTLDALRAQQRRQAEERAFFGPDYQVSDLVFTWERPAGASGCAAAAVQPIGRPARATGNPTPRPAPLLRVGGAGAGVPAKIVSERLGHAALAFTLTQYAT